VFAGAGGPPDPSEGELRLRGQPAEDRTDEVEAVGLVEREPPVPARLSRLHGEAGFCGGPGGHDGVDFVVCGDPGVVGENRAAMIVQRSAVCMSA
jgi:hypothetical protein